jgi:hypothetical protein
VSIDLEALRMLGASTPAPDASQIGAAERALFARPEVAGDSGVARRHRSRRRVPVLALALVVLGALFAVPAFGVQERLHDLFYGSPAPTSVQDSLAHSPGFAAFPANGVIEAHSSKGLMRLYYADSSDTGCVVQVVPFGVGGTTCGPVGDWSRLAVVGGLQIGSDSAGRSFTFAAGRFNAPAEGARFVYGDGQVEILRSYRGWFISEPDPTRTLVAFEAVDVDGRVVNRQSLSALDDHFDPRTGVVGGPLRTIMTTAYAGHDDVVISVGRTKAGTDGAWMTIDGLRRSIPSATDADGKSGIDFWSGSRDAYLVGFARASATRAAVGFEDGSADTVRIVEGHFFYAVTPAHLERGHRPTVFKLLDASGRVVDQVGRSSLLAALSIRNGGLRLETEAPAP